MESVVQNRALVTETDHELLPDRRWVQIDYFAHAGHQRLPVRAACRATILFGGGAPNNGAHLGLDRCYEIRPPIAEGSGGNALGNRILFTCDRFEQTADQRREARHAFDKASARHLIVDQYLEHLLGMHAMEKLFSFHPGREMAHRND